MTIRKKALLAITVIFVGLIVILFVISRFVLLENLNKLEKDNTSRDVERVLNVWAYTVSDLVSTTTDWSSWDDTYAFLEDGNSKYINSNLVDNTFIGIRLNLMLFIDSSGKTVFSKAFDLNSGEEIPVPQSLQARLTEDGLLLSPSSTGNQISGLLVLPENPPLLIASLPILHSDDSGPIRGTLIFGRYLDSTEVNRLGELTSLSLAYYRTDDMALSADIREIYPSLSQETPILTRPLNAQRIAGYSLIKDIYGNPGLILKVDMPRDIYQEGQRGITYLMLTIIAVGIVFGLLAAWIADKQGLSRLKKLAGSIESIATSGNISERVITTGNDEISSVANSVNSMLEALQLSENRLRESEQYYRSIFETAGAAMAIADGNHLLSLVNSEFEKLSGYSKEELEGKKRWIEFIKLDELTDVIEYQTRLRKEPGIARRNFECSFANRDGNVRDILLNIDLIPGTNMYVASLVNITERKKAERDIQKLYAAEAELRHKLEIEMQGRVEFTRALIHELKTPLTPMLTSAICWLLNSKKARF